MIYIIFEILRFPVLFFLMWIYLDLTGYYCDKNFSIRKNPRDRRVYWISSVLFSLYFCATLYLFPVEPKYSYTFLCVQFLLIFLTAKYLFQQPTKKVLIPTLLFITIYLVSLFIPYFVVALINLIRPEALNLHPISLELITPEQLITIVLLYNYLPLFLQFLMSKLLKRHKESFKNFSTSLNRINASFFILVIAGSFYTLTISTIIEVQSFIEIFFFLFFVLFSLSMFLFSEYKNKRLVADKEKEELFKYSATLGDIYEKTEKSREEHSWYLSKIKDHLKDKKYEESEVYISEILAYEKKASKQNKIIKMLPIKGLKGLLYIKLLEMEKQNLSIDVILSGSFSHFDYTSLNKTLNNDICKISGILIDNAMEAALLTENKEIAIEIYDENGALEINITNSFSDSINIHKIFTPGYSTKENGRGYGLVLANKIIRNHSNLRLTTHILDHHYFTQSVFLDYYPT